jgi:hypothetical protein
METPFHNVHDFSSRNKILLDFKNGIVVAAAS